MKNTATQKHFLNVKIRPIALAATLTISALIAKADRDDDDAPTSRPEKSISLHEEMEAMGHDFKVIRSQVGDASQNGSTLETVLDLEQHTLEAKSALPRSATTMATTQANAEKVSDYHAAMLNLLREELTLEEQLRANQNDKAAETVNGLHELETEGHKEFRPRRDRR